MKNSFRALLTTTLLTWIPSVYANGHGVFSQFQNDFIFSPSFDHFMACADIGCETRLTTGISRGEEAKIRALFGSVASPNEERRAISLALGLFELFVGRQDRIQTWGDLPKNTHLGNPVRSRQLDCFSESHNTLTYLLILADQKLIRFHSIGDIRRRGFLFDQHYAPVIVDRQTREDFIVDTWFLANASPAVLLPYSAWVEGNDAEYIALAKNRR